MLLKFKKIHILISQDFVIDWIVTLFFFRIPQNVLPLMFHIFIISWLIIFMQKFLLVENFLFCNTSQVHICCFSYFCYFLSYSETWLYSAYGNMWKLDQEESYLYGTDLYCSIYWYFLSIM